MGGSHSREDTAQHLPHCRSRFGSIEPCRLTKQVNSVGNTHLSGQGKALVRNGLRTVPISASMVHHLKAALAVGSLVTLLHAMGLLGWLDSVMLRLVAGASPILLVEPTPKASAGTDSAPMPRVLLIGSALHETAFKQASPLPSLPVAALLRSIANSDAGPPATLVIDLDLSPGPAEDPGRAALDAALQQLLARGTRLVLPLPIRVATPELQERKWRWLQQKCRMGGNPGDGRLLLALAEVVTTQGVAAQFDPATPSLGQLALASGEARSLCTWVVSAEEHWRAAMLSTAFDNRALPIAPHSRVLRPFNTRLFLAAERQVTLLRDTTLPPPLLAQLAGATVFLGGAYSSQDRFMTPFDGPQRRTEGAILHAAIYDSSRHPVSAIEGLAAWVLDVVLGVALGALFSATWGWHQRRVVTSNHFPGLAAKLAPRLSLATNLLLVAALVLLAMLLAQALFFPLNLWVNPGPVILGVFAKFVLVSRSTGHLSNAQHGDHATPHAPLVAATRLARIDNVLLVLLVLVTLIVLMLHH